MSRSGVWLDKTVRSNSSMICPVNNVERVIVLILHCLVILSLYVCTLSEIETNKVTNRGTQTVVPLLICVRTVNIYVQA